MRTPIAYSLAWPSRLKTGLKRLDLAAVPDLTFEEADEVRFPALRLAKDALKAGGAAPTVLNAANEIAVEAFLSHSIPFSGIAAAVEQTLSKAAAELSGILPDSLESVMHLDGRAREIAQPLCAGPRKVLAGAGLTPLGS
jgi:1-deoxy-D-xylulose-5-phosphate reductoisomerase